VRRDDDELDASVAGFVAIYSAIAVRNDAVNAAPGKALMGGPGKWQAVKRLRRDVHDPVGSCWFHGTGFCFFNHGGRGGQILKTNRIVPPCPLW
jgi:hypothetical protein